MNGASLTDSRMAFQMTVYVMTVVGLLLASSGVKMHVVSVHSTSRIICWNKLNSQQLTNYQNELNSWGQVVIRDSLSFTHKPGSHKHVMKFKYQNVHSNIKHQNGTDDTLLVYVK